ncbi:Protein of unknown function [Gryllus bimaculatus]|nr:Protein of unknown function [Gryllus bimaculatus]
MYIVLKFLNSFNSTLSLSTAFRPFLCASSEKEKEISVLVKRPRRSAGAAIPSSRRAERPIASSAGAHVSGPLEGTSFAARRREIAPHDDTSGRKRWKEGLLLRLRLATPYLRPAATPQGPAGGGAPERETDRQEEAAR